MQLQLHCKSSSRTCSVVSAQIPPFDLCIVHSRVVFTSPLVGAQSIALRVSVCLSVCALAYLKNHVPKLHYKFSVHVNGGRG